MISEVWIHRQTGDIALATPFYLRHLNFNQDYELGDFKVGAFVLSGYILENEAGVTFAFPIETKKYFEEIGEL